jgi:hypothetical protein
VKFCQRRLHQEEELLELENGKKTEKIFAGVRKKKVTKEEERPPLNMPEKSAIKF